MTACLDTDVLVESLRATPEAQAWLQSASSEVFFVPGVVAMELPVGCRNQTDVERTQKFLSTFSIVWPDAQDSVRAYELLVSYRLAHGLSIPDAFIASMALNRSVRLYTFNQKHYRMIAGLDVQVPYRRS